MKRKRFSFLQGDSVEFCLAVSQTVEIIGEAAAGADVPAEPRAPTSHGPLA